MAGGMLSGANNSGHAQGTTKAGVSEGTLIVRDTDKQQQEVTALNRDTDHANDGSISPIFNKEKEQNRLKQAQLIGEIGSQAMDVIRTQGEIAGLKAQTDPGALSQAREQLTKDGKPVSNADVMQRAYNNAMQQYGTGSDLQKAAQAVTGTLTALAGNNLAGALASGASPYLATEIKKLTTTDGQVNVAANAMAHAVLGAVTAQLNNQSAVAGGLGAGGGELAARYIAGQLFPDKTADQLNESEKQQVSALSQLAAGLAGGLATGDTGDTGGAVTAAQAGKNAVENNSLAHVLAAAEANKAGTIEKWQAEQQATIKEACSGGTPVSCQTMVVAAGSAMAWPLLPGAAATTSLIGAGANAGVGYMINGEVNPNDVILGYWTGAFTAGTGLWGTIAVNAGSGATSSYLKGDDPLKGGAMSGVASGLGYGAGKLVELPLDKILNPMKPWKDWIWVDVGMGISKPLPINPLPGAFGNAGASLGTEIINDQAGKVDVEKLKGNGK